MTNRLAKILKMKGRVPVKKFNVVLVMMAIMLVVSACSGNVEKPQEVVNGPTPQKETVVIKSSKLPDEVLS